MRKYAVWTLFRAFSGAGILALALGGAAAAAEYFVDQNHPWADDTGRGEEGRPWKTIGRAVTVARAGDTVWVKAGTYRETVRYWHYPGELFAGQLRFVTLAAWRNDKVVIEGTRPIEPSEWRRVEGTTNVFWVPLAEHPHQVFVDGQRYPEALKLRVEDKPDYERGTDQTETHVAEAMNDANPGKWLYDEKTRRLYLNTGDGNPSEQHRVEPSVHSFELNLLPPPDSPWGGRGILNVGVRLRGLTFNRLREGLTGYVTYSLIEDCVVREAGVDGMWLNGHHNIIRRCTVLHPLRQAIYWGGSEFVFEDNLIVGALENPHIAASAWMGVFKTNGGRHSTIRNNVVCEVERPTSAHPGSGIWCDIDSDYNAIYGNVCYRQGMGLYVEYTQNANVLAYNTLFENGSGIGVRANGLNLFLENYLFGNSTAIWVGSTDRYPPMIGNRFEGNWLVGGNLGITVGETANDTVRSAAPMGWNSVSLDRNTYQFGSNQVLVVWGERRYTDLAELRRETGQEFNGRQAAIDPTALQIVRFRNPHSRTPEALVPMLYNPTLLRVAPSGLGGTTRPYFWRQGDGSGLSLGAGAKGPGSATHGVNATAYPNLPKLWADGGSAVFGLVGVMVGPDASPAERAMDAKGKRWGIGVKGTQPADMHPLGEGWWSPSLPTRAGTKYKVSWAALADELQPTEGDPQAGPVVFAQFTDDNGQNRTRQYLWGQDDQGKPHGTLPNSGSYIWQQDFGQVTAPVGATRVAFFFGLRNSKGTVKYRDIYLQAE